MTIEIGIAYPTDPIYEEISRFAREVYLREFGATTDPRPDVFTYAIYEHKPVGCFGFYRAHQELLLFETYVPRAYERICGETQKRELLAELGTKVVRLPQGSRDIEGEVSLVMSAMIIKTAHAAGVRYLGFTTNRLAKRLAVKLDLSIIELGRPDLSGKTKEFQENWAHYFRIPQCVFGLDIHRVDGCDMALSSHSSRLCLTASAQEYA